MSVRMGHCRLIFIYSKKNEPIYGKWFVLYQFIFYNSSTPQWINALVVLITSLGDLLFCRVDILNYVED